MSQKYVQNMELQEICLRESEKRSWAQVSKIILVQDWQFHVQFWSASSLSGWKQSILSRTYFCCKGHFIFRFTMCSNIMVTVSEEDCLEPLKHLRHSGGRQNSYQISAELAMQWLIQIQNNLGNKKIIYFVPCVVISRLCNMFVVTASVTVQWSCEQASVVTHRTWSESRWNHQSERLLQAFYSLAPTAYSA